MRWVAGLLIATLLSGGISAQSADSELLLTLGRGEIVNAAWAPDGQSVWISTTAGTWQLDTNLQDIAAYPHITYAALSPDGTKLAGTSPDGYVAVWDFAMGAEVERWSARSLSPVAPDVPVWSPDNGRFILNTTGWHSYASPMLSGGLFILGERSNSPRPTGYGPARYAAWSTSGAYGAMYDPELDRIFVFTPNGDGVSLEGSDGIGDLSTTGETTYLRWRGDSELTYSTYGDGSEQRRWSMPDGRSLENVRYSNCAGYAGCSYSADGHYGALGVGVPGSYILSIFDLTSRNLLFEFETDKGYLTNPAWRPDSERIAAHIYTWPQNEMKGIVVLERKIGEVVWERNDTGILPEQLLWSPDGTRIFTYDSGGRMAILEGETGDVIVEADTLYSAALASFKPDDTLIAVASTGGSIYLIDSASDEPHDHLQRSGQTVAQILWQLNADPLVGASQLAVRDRQRYTDAGAVTIWNAETQDSAFTLPETIYTGGSTSGALSIVWKPDGTALAIGGYDRIWIHAAGETAEFVFPEPLTQSMYEQPVVEMAWRDGQDLPVVAYLKPCSHCLGYSHYPQALYDYSDDVRYNAVAGGWRATADGRLVMLQIRAASGEASFPFGVLALTTDGRSDAAIEGSATIAIERAWVSPNGRFAAATDADRDGLVWDENGTPAHFLSNVEELQWTSDDSTLAILQRNGSVWLQDADGLRLLWSPPLPVKSPGTLVWSNDGSTLAHVQDGVLRIWKP